MGWELEEEEIPMSFNELCEEVQDALILFNSLPDKIEGMAGLWLGKDFSGLGDIMDIMEIQDRQEVMFYLQAIIRQYSEYYEEKRKQTDTQAKAKVRSK